MPSLSPGLGRRGRPYNEICVSLRVVKSTPWGGCGQAVEAALAPSPATDPPRLVRRGGGGGEAGDVRRCGRNGGRTGRRGGAGAGQGGGARRGGGREREGGGARGGGRTQNGS